MQTSVRGSLDVNYRILLEIVLAHSAMNHIELTIRKGAGGFNSVHGDDRLGQPDDTETKTCRVHANRSLEHLRSRGPSSAYMYLGDCEHA
nr:hypothetical protein [Tanacetum cinerariifolium]